MLKTPGSGGINAYNRVKKAYHSVPYHGSTTNTSVTPSYDSSSLSTVADAASRAQLDAVSRISNDVRTATTTGRIQELRQAVSSGNYQTDPVEIAKRMMLLVEG